MIDAWCPKCEKEVEVPEPWDSFECPECGLNGCWEECCTDDYSDCWPVAEWDYN